MERCRAIIDLLVVRPDGFWFKEPVSLEDVPDYLDVRLPPPPPPQPLTCWAMPDMSGNA